MTTDSSSDILNGREGNAMSYRLARREAVFAEGTLFFFFFSAAGEEGGRRQREGLNSDIDDPQRKGPGSYLVLECGGGLGRFMRGRKGV